MRQVLILLLVVALIGSTLVHARERPQRSVRGVDAWKNKARSLAENLAQSEQNRANFVKKVEHLPGSLDGVPQLKHALRKRYGTLNLGSQQLSSMKERMVRGAEELAEEARKGAGVVAMEKLMKKDVGRMRRFGRQ